MRSPPSRAQVVMNGRARHLHLQLDLSVKCHLTCTRHPPHGDKHSFARLPEGLFPGAICSVKTISDMIGLFHLQPAGQQYMLD